MAGAQPAVSRASHAWTARLSAFVPSLAAELFSEADVFHPWSRADGGRNAQHCYKDWPRDCGSALFCALVAGAAYADPPVQQSQRPGETLENRPAQPAG